MAVSRLLTDSTTRARLGPELLAELRANLWAVDCQTCGRGFGRWERPALTVQATADTADASLHHRGCRSPQWLESPTSDRRVFTDFPHATWRAKLVLLTGSTLVFLVNPSYEVAQLRRDSGRWRLATLDRFAAYGMGTDLFDGVIAQPSLSVVVDEDRMSVHITDKGAVVHSWHVSPLSPGIREAVDAKEWLTVGLTTSLDLHRRMPRNPMAKLIKARRMRLGAARTVYTQQAQLLSETDFGKTRLKLLGVSCEVIWRQLGIKVDDDLLIAALACSAGNSEMITRLRDRDKLVSALLVIMLYAAASRTASEQPAHGGGVHVMAADAAGVAQWFDIATATAELTGQTVIRLAAEPTVEQRRTEYLADIVVGTPEQFRAAYAFYRDDDGDWGLHETRGNLAMTVLEVQHRVGELIRRYPRVAVI
ncbi:hypothetical protein [Streptomyces viridochromogenes]|uniref:hypothetical protein n=1 Tax=Streptomyces viridochromogenes TaxID=1938 RepID=UPI00069DC9DF|nr:hypothetical protein [Streptomyces viridochromogenes]KOG07673.1 hypothetical protein ADK35_43740 [Streptomyces viridochromogenes]KOG12815.1 hypothetical protein ADK36_34760 [Streptomyces viridochromogenes]